MDSEGDEDVDSLRAGDRDTDGKRLRVLLGRGVAR